MWNSQNKSEIACVFAGLILNENGIEISENSLKKIFTASNVNLENYWFYLFPKLVKEIDFKDLIGVSSVSESKIQEVSKQNIKEEEVQENSTIKESDEDMGFGLFD